mmetsp:Transcript_49409/g.148884  ORF Transcript_49409/g.148884 Transcript_49409/m.148884 type:complete len:279 (+) Transcript_49409:991-1827(+)
MDLRGRLVPDPRTSQSSRVRRYVGSRRPDRDDAIRAAILRGGAVLRVGRTRPVEDVVEFLEGGQLRVRLERAVRDEVGGEGRFGGRVRRSHGRRRERMESSDQDLDTLGSRPPGRPPPRNPSPHPPHLHLHGVRQNQRRHPRGSVRPEEIGGAQPQQQPRRRRAPPLHDPNARAPHPRPRRQSPHGRSGRTERHSHPAVRLSGGQRIRTHRGRRFHERSRRARASGSVRQRSEWRGALSLLLSSRAEGVGSARQRTDGTSPGRHAGAERVGILGPAQE